MYYTLTYKNRPVIEESKLGVLIENQLFESALGIPNDTCHFWCENLKLTGTEHQKRTKYGNLYMASVRRFVIAIMR